MFDILDIVEEHIMGINYFTDEQVEQLKKNPYVKHVSNKSITYEDSFKEYFYLQYTSGYTPTQIFRMAGFDTNVLKERRIKGFYLRNKALANSDDGFIDRRKCSSGRPQTKNLTPEEIIDRLKQKNKILKQENDFLKRVRLLNKKQILVQSKTKLQNKNSN